MRSLFRFVRNRRRTFAIGLTLVVGFVAAFLDSGSSQLTVAAYNRLRIGMTLPEVESALGVTPGRYDAPPYRHFVVQETEATWTFDPTPDAWRDTGPGTGVFASKNIGGAIAYGRYWVDGDHLITVGLLDGRVVSRSHLKATPAYEAWIRRQLAWLGF